MAVPLLILGLTREPFAHIKKNHLRVLDARKIPLGNLHLMNN